jgi:hypothetical protein
MSDVQFFSDVPIDLGGQVLLCLDISDPRMAFQDATPRRRPLPTTVVAEEVFVFSLPCV